MSRNDVRLYRGFWVVDAYISVLPDISLRRLHAANKTEALRKDRASDEEKIGRTSDRHRLAVQEITFSDFVRGEIVFVSANRCALFIGLRTAASLPLSAVSIDHIGRVPSVDASGCHDQQHQQTLFTSSTVSELFPLIRNCNELEVGEKRCFLVKRGRNTKTTRESQQQKPKTLVFREISLSSLTSNCFLSSEKYGRFYTQSWLRWSDNQTILGSLWPFLSLWFSCLCILTVFCKQ